MIKPYVTLIDTLKCRRGIIGLQSHRWMLKSTRSPSPFARNARVNIKVSVSKNIRDPATSTATDAFRDSVASARTLRAVNSISSPRCERARKFVQLVQQPLRLTTPIYYSSLYREVAC
jgi:hypothetical protein